MSIALKAYDQIRENTNHTKEKRIEKKLNKKIRVNTILTMMKKALVTQLNACSTT